MEIDPKLIDGLLAQSGRRVQDIAGETGLLGQLTKAILVVSRKMCKRVATGRLMAGNRRIF